MDQNDLQELARGKESRFWRIIVEELQRRVQKLTDDVMDELIDPDEEKRKKFKASSYKSLIDLPDTLIRENEASLPEKKSDPSEAY